MLLDEWIFFQEKQGNTIKCSEIARDLNRNSQTIRNIKRGLRRPHLSLAKQIEAYTGGMVTAAELRGERNERT